MIEVLEEKTNLTLGNLKSGEKKVNAMRIVEGRTETTSKRSTVSQEKEAAVLQMMQANECVILAETISNMMFIVLFL